MAIDILQQIIEFLNINCSIVNCNYATPMESVFYLVLFPSVFLILFVYVLSAAVVNRLLSENKGRGARLLIGIVIFVYIIINDLYNLIIPLSQLWIILVIILGGIWWFIGKHFGGGRETGAMAGVPKGKIGQMFQEGMRRADPRLNVFDLKTANGYCRGIDSSIAKFESDLSDYGNLRDDRARADFKKTLENDDKSVEKTIDRLDDFVKEKPELRRSFDKKIDSYRDELTAIRRRRKVA